jgi:quinolinate synthase
MPASNTPQDYLSISDADAIRRINEHKEHLGDSLCILGHHYQRPEIVALSNHVGDSFQLARVASEQEKAEYIMFCGVEFMADAAEILSRDDQVVLHPDISAGCPLANYANGDQVQAAWDVITKSIPGKRIIPVTYVNSGSDVKAFCGKHGGIVCTSSNASRVFDWAFERGEVIMFFPDQHLGWNTSRRKGITSDQSVIWDPHAPNGGLTSDDIQRARVILWKGHCHVHTRFTVDHVTAMRVKYPDVQVIVHPECPADVVDAADANGSTSFLVNYVQEAEEGGIIAIGTELNLVSRIATEAAQVFVTPLDASLCWNMDAVSLQDVLWTLDNLGETNVVTVSSDVKQDARTALERMLGV